MNPDNLSPMTLDATGSHADADEHSNESPVPIPVTRSSMPDFDAFVEEIRPLWE